MGETSRMNVIAHTFSAGFFFFIENETT